MSHNFISPVNNARLTSKFGFRDIGRGKEWHQGVDLASQKAGVRVPVFTSREGKVVYDGALGSYGKCVRIVHDVAGVVYETNYAHLDSYNVVVGEKVEQGQQIGVMGNTDNGQGKSNPKMGVHLHFEIHRGRWATGQPNAVDPMKWVDLKNNPSDVNVNKRYIVKTGSFATMEDAEVARLKIIGSGIVKIAHITEE